MATSWSNSTLKLLNQSPLPCSIANPATMNLLGSKHRGKVQDLSQSSEKPLKPSVFMHQKDAIEVPSLNGEPCCSPDFPAANSGFV